MSLLNFGPFQFDDRTLELWRDGRPVPIRPQPSRLLSLLVARPGELVTREEITAVLWPGIHVRFDLGLNSCLKQIRAALDDHAEQPRWVETLSRRGYRFLGAVREDGDLAQGPGIRRVIVLPVRAIDPTDERLHPLVHGLRDDIVAQLTRHASSLAIVPAASLPDDAAEKPSLRALARHGVDFAIDCRVYCAGPQFRVAAQLLDVGGHVIAWASVFDGTVDDRFAAQRRIAAGVVDSLRSTSGCESRASSPPRDSTSSTAAPLRSPSVRKLPHRMAG